MSQVQVFLMGNPYVTMNGEKINFPYKKAEGLFYYLCIKKNTTREAVIQVLWADDDESAGRKSLREAVYQIKKIFGKEFLVTKGHSAIGLNPECMPLVDIDDLDEDNIIDRDKTDEGLLCHFHIKNSFEFEEWMDELRNQYDKMYMDSAHQRLYKADAGKDERDIQKYSNILIRHDPFNEKLYHEIMDIYAVHGSYNLAIKLYYDLQKVLKAELDVEPSKEVTDLFHRIYDMKENLEESAPTSENFFFGRTEELYMIGQNFIHFFQGKSAKCLFIEGEEGVGKSALFKRSQQIASGYKMLVLSAECYRDETDFFLNLWKDIFLRIRQYEEKGFVDNSKFLEQEQVVEGILEGNNDIPFSKGHEGVSYQFIEQAILEIFQIISRKTKILLCVDNAQWMDSLSAQLINRIVITCGIDRVVFLTTFLRSYEAEILSNFDPLLQRDYMETIWLDCFTEKEVAQILDQALPGVVDERRRRESIYEMTGGNAFFLRELITVIREKGYTLEMSRKTLNVIQSRLSSLSDEDNQILNCMSIFPERVSAQELTYLMPMSEMAILERLEKLRARNLVLEVLVGWNVYYAFQHRMFREFAYDRQSEGRKRAFHKILGERYEEEYKKSKSMNLLPLLTYHFERCHDQQKIYQYKILYSQEFYMIFHENIPLLDMDMESSLLPKDISEGAGEMLSLADEVIRWDDSSPEGVHVKMEMHYIIGRYQIAIGDYIAGCMHMHDCLSIARELDNVTYQINYYRQMVFYYNQIGDLNKMKVCIDEGIALLDREKDSDMYGVFLRLMGLHLLLIGEYEQAEETLMDSIEVFEHRKTGKRRHSMNISACMNYLGDIKKNQGDYQAALAYYMGAIENNTHRVVTNGLSQSYSNVGQIYYLLGEYDRARSYLNNAIEFFEKYDYYWGRGKAEGYMALSELALGNKKAAKMHLRKAKYTNKKINNPAVREFLNGVSQIIK